MKKLKIKKRALALSMAVGLLSVSTATAQDMNKGGLFQRGMADEEYYAMGSYNSGLYNVNRDPINGGFTPQDFEGPVGSGLLILAAAGAGYALLRRKEDKQ